MNTKQQYLQVILDEIKRQSEGRGQDFDYLIECGPELLTKGIVIAFEKGLNHPNKEISDKDFLEILQELKDGVYNGQIGAFLGLM